MTLSFAPERIEQWPLARLQPYARNAKAHGERWKEICWDVGLHRSAAHQHWQFGISVIALTLNKRRFNRNLSKQRVIELASGA